MSIAKTVATPYVIAGLAVGGVLLVITARRNALLRGVGQLVTNIPEYAGAAHEATVEAVENSLTSDRSDSQLVASTAAGRAAAMGGVRAADPAALVRLLRTAIERPDNRSWISMSPLGRVYEVVAQVSARHPISRTDRRAIRDAIRRLEAGRTSSSGNPLSPGEIQLLWSIHRGLLDDAARNSGQRVDQYGNPTT